MERYKDVVEVLQKLPKFSYSVNPSQPEMLIGIHRGVPGYTPLKVCKSKEEAEAMAKRLNDKNNVTEKQRDAMCYGSCFGWHLPIADPDNL